MALLTGDRVEVGHIGPDHSVGERDPGRPIQTRHYNSPVTMRRRRATLRDPGRCGGSPTLTAFPFNPRRAPSLVSCMVRYRCQSELVRRSCIQLRHRVRLILTPTALPWTPYSQAWKKPVACMAAVPHRKSCGQWRISSSRCVCVSPAVHESMTICGVIRLRRLEGRRANCRSPGRDTIVRTAIRACRRAPAFEFEATGAHRVLSTASAGVWRSVC